MSGAREGPAMLLRHAECVLFDFDGTLVDSCQRVLRAFSEFAEMAGVTVTDEVIRRFDGLTTFEIVERAKADWPLRESLEAVTHKYFELLAKSYAQTVEFPMSTALLKLLAHRCQALGLVTSAAQELIEPVLQRLGWTDLFNCSIFGTRGVPGKPNPMLYRMALDRLQMSPLNSIAVEDSIAGVRAATAAKISTIAVVRDVSFEDVREAGACFVVKDLLCLC